MGPVVDLRQGSRIIAPIARLTTPSMPAAGVGGAAERAELPRRPERPGRGVRDEATAVLAFAVRKTQDAFPNMITVGRTLNNDIVLYDVKISKFHAYFRQTAERVELFDAGSRNGTWAAGQAVVAKGAPGVLRIGDHVKFSHHEFAFVDAGAAWDLMRRAVRTLRVTPTAAGT